MYDVVGLFAGNVSVKQFADNIKIHVEVINSSQTAVLQAGIISDVAWAHSRN